MGDWAKAIDAKRVFYTPKGDSPVTRVVYDPDKPEGERIVCYLKYLHIPTAETKNDLDGSFGISADTASEEP